MIWEKKSCNIASVTPTLRQKELIPRCRTVKNRLNSHDYHTFLLSYCQLSDERTGIRIISGRLCRLCMLRLKIKPGKTMVTNWLFYSMAKVLY